MGTKVLLTGKMFTARDKAHQLLSAIIREGKTLPFDLQDSTIYYTGPAINKQTGLFISAGPTTSSRMDKYTPFLLGHGVKCLIGKGQRNREVIDSLVANKAVYLSAVGGAGVLLADSITRSRIIAFPELGPEAIYEIWVENFPCYVAIDIYGNNIYNQHSTI